MQSVKVSWVVQPFALARCSDSQGKKSRSRKTKEERKTMVESFIKRYRNSNSGNFPSLNLTHKEVGGSFYTIREIVREIIQENKVLRPGSLTSQAFNLDDPSEEHSSASFSLEHLDHSSLGTNGLVTDELQKETYLFSSENNSFSKEVIIAPCEQANNRNYEAIKCDSQETFASSNDILVSTEPSEQGGNNLHSDEAVCIEALSNEVKDRKLYNTNDIGFSQTLSKTFISDVPTAMDVGCGMQADNANEGISFSVGRDYVSKIAVADKPETRVLMDLKTSSISEHLENESSAVHTGEVFPLQALDSRSCSSDQRSTEVDLSMGSSEVVDTNVYFNGKEISTMPVYPEPTVKRVNSVESLSSATINEKASMGIKTSVLDVSDCPMADIKKLEVPHAHSPNDVHMKKVNTASERDSEAAASVDIKSELKHCSGSNDTRGHLASDGTRSETSEGDKQKIETPEENPLWAVIKGAFTAFIKFWTEE